MGATNTTKRQCYTGGNDGTLYVSTDGMPKELVFPSVQLHPAGLQVGLIGFAAMTFDAKSRGDETVITVPAISLDDLPAADVESECFVFWIKRHASPSLVVV